MIELLGLWLSWDYFKDYLLVILPLIGAGLVLVFVIRLVSRKKKQKKSRKNFMSLAYIRRLDGFQFENYVARQLAELGMLIERTPLSGDFGIDLLVEGRYAVQLKNYTNPVGISAVQETYAGAAYYDKLPVLMASNRFTKSAIAMAESLNVELIDVEDIENFSSDYYLRNFNHQRGFYELVKKYLSGR